MVVVGNMAQVLRKEYTCFNCKKNILISKVHDPNSKKRWEQWELDSVTPHNCSNKGGRGEKPQDQKTLPRSELANLEKEIASLKADVKSLTYQIQMLRKEFGQAFGVVQKQD